MNVRVVVLLLAIAVQPALAREVDKNAEAAAAVRTTLLQSAGRGSNITSNNQQYQILMDVRAVEKNSQEEPEQTLARMGGGKLIETNGDLVVFAAVQEGVASVASVNGTSYPTALNSATGGIGILPGTLNVKLKNMGHAAAIASDHGLEVVRVFAHLQTAFFRVKAGKDVVAAAAALSTDARIISAEVEVIEHMNVPY